MYGVEVQMLCCRAECTDGIECNQLFRTKQEAKAYLSRLKRQIRNDACCTLPLMMIEEYREKEQDFVLTVTRPAEGSAGNTLP